MLPPMVFKYSMPFCYYIQRYDALCDEWRFVRRGSVREMTPYFQMARILLTMAAQKRLGVVHRIVRRKRFSTKHYEQVGMPLCLIDSAMRIIPATQESSR